MIYDVLRSKNEKIADAFFYVMMLLLTIERAFISEGTGAFIQYFILLFAACAIFAWRKYFGKLHLAIIFYMVFLVVGTISDFREIGAYSNRILWDLLRTWIGCFLMIPAYNMARRSHSKSVAMIYCLLFFSIATAVCQIVGIGNRELGVERGVVGERVGTFGANVNGTARVVSLGVLFAGLVMLGGIKLKSKFVATMLLCAAGVCTIALARTGSRGGLIMCVLTMFFLPFTTNGVSKKMIGIVVVGFLLCLTVFVVLNNQMLQDRIDKAIFENDTGSRDYIRYACRCLWAKAKWFGYGCNVYKVYLGNEVGKVIRSTHNTYYYGFMGGGIVGAMFYYLSLGTIAWKVYKIRKFQYGNFLFLVMVLMFASGWIMNIENNKWLYIMYGTVLGMEEKIRRDARMGIPSILAENDRPRFIFARP